jgi:hypothetical protein
MLTYAVIWQVLAMAWHAQDLRELECLVHAFAAGACDSEADGMGSSSFCATSRYADVC